MSERKSKPVYTLRVSAEEAEKQMKETTERELAKLNQHLKEHKGEFLHQPELDSDQDLDPQNDSDNPFESPSEEDEPDPMLSSQFIPQFSTVIPIRKPSKSKSKESVKALKQLVEQQRVALALNKKINAMKLQHQSLETQLRYQTLDLSNAQMETNRLQKEITSLKARNKNVKNNLWWKNLYLAGESTVLTAAGSLVFWMYLTGGYFCIDI
jgi:hypothetical protein